MKKVILSVLIAVGFMAIPKAHSQELNTEKHELFCDMNDLLQTRIFVDSDTDYDQFTNQLSPKILEFPTKNAIPNKLFQVVVLSVSHARCPDCKDTQTIIYKSEDILDIINKLEITKDHAKITRNVDEEGNPKPNMYFVDEGDCHPNEVE